MRKSIPKSVREQIYQKCDGHCAYCGCKLDYKDMQVDHIDPVYTSKLDDDKLNDISNYLPSCRSCNFYKSTFDLETFRHRLETTLYENLSNNFNYKLLKKYGLIKEDIKPIVFYFERHRKEK